MPPKHQSTAPRSRSFRFTARKRVPNSTPSIRARTRICPTDSASGTAESRLPSTDIPDGSECSQDSVPGCASVAITAVGEVPHAKTISQAQSDGLQKTLATDSGLGRRDKNRICGRGDEKSGNPMEPDNLGSEKIPPAEMASSSGSEDGNKNAVDLQAESLQLGEGNSSQPLARPDTASPGKRKIVRKTVRIVKKVIKKRVPKRLLASGLEDQILMEKPQDGLNLTEESQSLISSSDGDERNGNDGILEAGKEMLNLKENMNFSKDCNVGVGNMNITDEGKQELKFVSSTSVEPTGKCDDSSTIGSMKEETLGSQFGASVSEPTMGEEGGNPSGIDSMNLGKSMFQLAANVSEEICKNQSGAHAIDVNRQDNDGENSVEPLNVKYPSETVMDTMEVETSAMENQPKVSVAGNQFMDFIDNDDRGLIPCQPLDSEEENVEGFVGEQDERKMEKPESGNGGMESDTNRLNEYLLSGEMEALERRKRRKTEVFVGGLDRYTNEDEIRKVLSEVGEILEVRLAMNGTTGKNKGFAFVRFATAADARKALANYSEVEIRGKRCGVVPVEGNDTIFLGSIDRDWKTEDVVRLLERAGIQKIDNVTLKVDPKNTEKNRGFGFVEFETCRDAEVAFHKLQTKDVFGRNRRVKIQWAQPLVEPDKEELLKVKSVYAEFLPSTWDEEAVKEHFKRFGEIENVVLAKHLASSRREDFAFVTYTTRDEAVACIEAINREKLEDGGSKVKIAVSLAKPIPKSKQMKHTSDLTSKPFTKAKPKRSQTSKKHHQPRNKGMPAGASHRSIKVDSEPSTTVELVQLLRQQASSHPMRSHPWTGPDLPEYDFPLPGSKRPYSLMAHDPPYVEPEVLPRTRLDSSYPISSHRSYNIAGRSYPITSQSSSSYGAGLSSFPYHRGGPVYASGERRFHPDDYQTTEEDRYYLQSNRYRRY